MMEDAIEVTAPTVVTEEQETTSPLNHNVIDMTEVPEGEESSLITSSVKDEFNPNAIQNGLVDEEVEGGVYRYKSTGNNLTSGKDGGRLNPSLETEDATVILSGFKAMRDNYAFDVVAKFPDLATAKASINGSKFIYIEKGKMVVADIISGTPVISDEDKEVAKYAAGEWKRP